MSSIWRCSRLFRSCQTQTESTWVGFVKLGDWIRITVLVLLLATGPQAGHGPSQASVSPSVPAGGRTRPSIKISLSSVTLQFLASPRLQCAGPSGEFQGTPSPGPS